jgi:hypothetical protein
MESNARPVTLADALRVPSVRDVARDLVKRRRTWHAAAPGVVRALRLARFVNAETSKPFTVAQVRAAFRSQSAYAALYLEI